MLETIKTLFIIATVTASTTLSVNSIPTTYVPVLEPNNAVSEHLEDKKTYIECEKELSTEQCAIRERVRVEFADTPEMENIVKCESGFMQFKSNGEIVKSHTDDYGIFQINEKTWLKKAIEMGIDIYTVDGNFAMARHVLEKQGLGAWVCYKK